MAKRRPARRAKTTRKPRKRTSTRRSGKRPTKRAKPRRKAAAPRKAPRKVAAPRKTARRARRPVARKAARLDRARRTLEETVPTPPSSLDMQRHGSSVRSGRKEIADRQLQHKGMSTAITAGDVDVDLEDAYFTGDEAPGGDNPAPDQEVVDDIGKALGVEYADNEELKSSDKVVERDKHRWELDPASSEDYKERKP
jgi:uncharacterized protein DUF6335